MNNEYFSINDFAYILIIYSLLRGKFNDVAEELLKQSVIFYSAMDPRLNNASVTALYLFQLPKCSVTWLSAKKNVRLAVIQAT